MNFDVLSEFPRGTRVLELGPYDGRHTVELARRFDSVVCVEGRRSNLTLTRRILRERRITNVTLRQDDLETCDLKPGAPYGLVVCSGVLYHLQSPWRLIDKIGGVTSAVLVWTHYWNGKPDYQRFGYEIKKVQETYRIAGMRGLKSHSHWLTRPSLFQAFEDYSFTQRRVLSEDRTRAPVCFLEMLCLKARSQRVVHSSPTEAVST